MIRTILASIILSSCAIISPGPDGVDLSRLADEVSLVRQDVSDLAPLASPETQVSLAELDKAVHQVEAALRAAAAGGPVDTVTGAARAALDLADHLLAGMAPEEIGDLRLYVGLARIALRHIAAAQFDEAQKALLK